MADEQQYKILKEQGVSNWNEWRRRNIAVVPDLIEADLREANLSWANLGMADLTGADLSMANPIRIDDACL